MKDNQNTLTNLDKNGSLKKTRLVREKRERIPLNEQRRIIGIEKDPNYVYRLVNDTDRRVESFILAGYEIIDKDGNEIPVDKRMQDPSWRHSALSQPVGGGVTGYMMRIPREWWEEDQAKKHEKADQKEKDKNFTLNLSKEESKNFYGKVKIEHEDK